MPNIEYDGEFFQRKHGETVLAALLRQGKSPVFSCRNGVCQICLHRCFDGSVPERSQRGLRTQLKELGYFLPCVAVPDGDIRMLRPRAADLFSLAVIVGKSYPAPDVCRLLLEPASSLYYHAGQFIHLRRPDGLVRSYSLASVPAVDAFLELHVKRVPGGEMSKWIFDDLAVNSEVEFRGPFGDCFYAPGSQERNVLLIGTGTGLAPLVGIIRDALHTGHAARLSLFHGSRRPSGLYLYDDLRELERRHSNFRYFPCVSGDSVPNGFLRGRAHRRAMAATRELHGWLVYLAGHPGMIEDSQTMALRAGADPALIRTDPHDSPPRSERVDDRVDLPPASIGHDDPERLNQAGSSDAELWRALDQGRLMRVILEDFYERVFDDPILAPYFRGVTRQRLIGQVYSFMRDELTGEKLYFGIRPRGAHHWMVISDEIFDHRERLMEDCLRRHGISEPMVRRWRQIEEKFRPEIVKPEPVPLIVDGVELPLDGFGEEVVSVGTVCDSCQAEVHAGERVRYHLRLGTVYCRDCAEIDARP